MIKGDAHLAGKHWDKEEVTEVNVADRSEIYWKEKQLLVGAAEENPDKYEAQLKNKQLLNKLNLTENFNQKLKTADVLKISKPCTENDRVQTFLQRLLLMNYRARCGESGQIIQTQIPSVTDNDDEDDFYTDLFKSSSEEAVQSSLVHPMDVQMAVFHCSDSFLKQLIVTKLSQCQYALPLLVPDPFTGEIEFPLWTFRQIRKSWKSTNNLMKKISKEKSIATLETPVVSFFRLGTTSTSKSQLMNRLINEKHDTFFHRDCPGSSRNRLLMDGVVEIAWYCPSGKSTDHFTDCVAFCNLHGEAETHEKQLEILTEMSSVNVVVLGDQEKNIRSTKLQNLYKLSTPMICLLSEESSSVTQLKSGKYRIGIKNRNQSDVSAELRKTIGELISKTFTLEKLAELSDIKVDEENGECKQGKDSAKTMINFLDKKDIFTMKETHLPCHGILWKNWCQKNKELHRPQDGNLELTKSRLRMEMEKIREQQKACGLTEFMDSFIEKLNTQTAEEMRYFLKWITIFLDKHNSDLSFLQKDYNDKWTKILNLKKKHDKSGQLEKEQTELENISDSFNAATFGLEHIFREIGQIYESHMSVKKKKKQSEEKLNRFCLPELAAELIISGYPLELMDGDAAHVPLIWVSAVLDELSRKLGDQRVFVFSVLGLQSSGKSTMLNAMFGLQFAVSAGRCTRGAFMQLVKVSEEMKGELKFDYILVVDTEGLRAPELAGMSTRHHDNELATFVVGLGNLTLINIFGENPSEMQDILQIVVQAFMRMKKVRLKPSCVFVHQNVTDVAAGDKNMEGRRRLQEKLDEMTNLAAKEEVCEAESFSDVIAFDVQEDVRYFAQLWEGSPPMAPPNPSYSECVQELKNTILKKASTTHTLTLSEFSTRLKDLWSALLHENFVFSFRNTLEITIYRKLEAEFSKWTWNLRSAILSIEDKLLNRIANGDLHVGEKDLIGNMKKTREEVTKSMMQFFEEDKDKYTLIQWKSRFTSKIEELHDDLIRETKRKLCEVIEQKKTKETLEKRKTDYEKKLFNLSKELALRQNKEKTDEQTLKREFDNVWKKWITDPKQDTPKIKDIDFWEDVRRILSESNETSLVHERLSLKAYKNIDINVSNKSEQPQTQTKGGWASNFVLFVRNKLTKNKDVNAEDEILIRDLINDIVEKTSKSAEAIWRTQSGYNSGQVQEIIELVKNTVKKYQTKKQSYLFSRELTVDLCLFACNFTEPTFLECHEQFTKANDPEHYLENQKEQYYNVYKNFCQGATTTAIFGELLCSKLEPSILEAVYNEIAINVAAEMRASIPALMSNRSNLEKHILKTLAEKENFEDYREYIHNPKQYFTRFIRNQALKYLNNEKNKIQTIFRGNLENKNLKINNAVFVATDEVLKKQGNANMWMGCFSKPLKEDLKFSEISNVDFMEITDFDFLCKIVTEGLTKMVKKLHEADINLEMLQKRSEKILIDHFCQCCWAQCPFCKAICISTMKDHDGEHCVPFHRADGIIGWYYSVTGDLGCDFCTTLVQTDKGFFPSGESKSVPYKQYRTAGGKYATWNITPDCSEMPYWKWFVGRFQKDLENLYSKKFQGSGKIPDEWKKYTKEDALESLNNYI
ncbi:interferon-induced very large GTPase 1-like [Astyanax mexicanus]|uniref:interferon-induced very large GTPase 1-like n=1 Tax=Astyanax mexicanus TaxID=7994 RepID=UPI0020CB0B3E|nr:interferon-induced very large GTPase 1-like [Astyanax mexicanus]